MMTPKVFNFFLTFVLVIVLANDLGQSLSAADSKGDDDVQVPPAITGAGLTGFLAQLVKSYQQIKIQIEPTWKLWLKEIFNTTETPEMVQKRRIIWRQLTEAQFG